MPETSSTDLGALASSLVRDGVAAIAVSVQSAHGSTPREAGSWMVVTQQSSFGTVGGGRLEWLVLENARNLLSAESAGPVARNMQPVSEEISLGPQINQCCGGRVTLRFEVLDETVLERLAAQDPMRSRPVVQIHGAGHTGLALARALSLLPVETMLVDVRAEQLALAPGTVRTVHAAMPETMVREADASTAYVVLTHSHDLDFLIAAEALARRDASYVGMIGSKTKRAVFLRWLKDNGYPQEIAAQLTCPIGAGPRGRKPADKRPEVIAALTAAELLIRFESLQDDSPA